MSKRCLAVLLLIILFTSAAGCTKKSSTTQGDARPLDVTVASLAKETLVQKITVVGKVTAKDEVKVVPKSSGKVAQVYVEVGQTVAAGSVLLELENSDLQLTIQKTQIQLDDANRTLERKKQLYERGAITKSDFDTAESAVRTLQVTLDQNRLDLANSQVKSPINGIVASRSINPGEFVSNSSAPFTVVNIDSVEVNASLIESEINYVKPGQEVEVLVTAVSPTPVKGIVSKVSPSASSTDKTYPMWVNIANPDQRLKPGMFAEVTLVTNQLDGVIIVANETIVERNGKKFAFVEDGGKAAGREVKTGLSQEGRTVVLEGLKEGDRLITSGLSAVKDGTPINPKTPKNGTNNSK
ncbi:MAG: efflux RND transporter periplasmic adaptor subunit [Firmicutes bacterium]|nr:efflux RND transporter periplasmic adaptor subunit [Bacillota bacterium]